MQEHDRHTRTATDNKQGDSHHQVQAETNQEGGQRGRKGRPRNNVAAEVQMA